MEDWSVEKNATVTPKAVSRASATMRITSARNTYASAIFLSTYLCVCLFRQSLSCGKTEPGESVSVDPCTAPGNVHAKFDKCTKQCGNDTDASFESCRGCDRGMSGKVFGASL